MNKLVIPNGGMPLEGDDFKFFQDAYAEAFLGVFSEIANRVPITGHPNTFKNFIISGCEITDIGGGNSSISDGFVFIDGEILYAVAVGSVSNASLVNVAYRLHSYYAPAGNEVFQDSSTQDTYEVRRAQTVTLGGSPTVPVVFVAQPNYRFKNLLTHADVDSIYDVNAEGTLANSWADIGDGILVTKQFGRVMFRGSVFGGTLGGATVLTLSTGFRPSVQMRFLCSYGGDGIALCSLSTSGVLSVEQVIAPSGVATLLDLNSISYTIE
jgi:hypothetical protein